MGEYVIGSTAALLRVCLTRVGQPRGETNGCSTTLPGYVIYL